MSEYDGYVNESWRTPDEQEILEDFEFSVSNGTQWQLWHRSKLKDTFWDREEAEIQAVELWASHGSYPNSRWKDHSASPEFRTDYANLEIQSDTDNRWMTSPTFIVEVSIVKPPTGFHY